MEILYSQCVGWMCIKDGRGISHHAGCTGQRYEAIRIFGTVTQEFLPVQDWLWEGGCTHVAMKATGVYRRQSTVYWKASLRCWSSMLIISKRYRDKILDIEIC